MFDVICVSPLAKTVPLASAPVSAEQMLCCEASADLLGSALLSSRQQSKTFVKHMCVCGANF
jgi:hypothetical protein